MKYFKIKSILVAAVAVILVAGAVFFACEKMSSPEKSDSTTQNSINKVRKGWISINWKGGPRDEKGACTGQNNSLCSFSIEINFMNGGLSGMNNYADLQTDDNGNSFFIIPATDAMLQNGNIFIVEEAQHAVADNGDVYTVPEGNYPLDDSVGGWKIPVLF